MLYVFHFYSTSKNSLSKFIVTDDVLSYATPFVTYIVCLIASVIVSGGEVILILTFHSNR